MSDELLKSVTKNSASVVIHISMHYLYFALICMETKILW